MKKILSKAVNHVSFVTMESTGFQVLSIVLRTAKITNNRLVKYFLCRFTFGSLWMLLSPLTTSLYITTLMCRRSDHGPKDKMQFLLFWLTHAEHFNGLTSTAQNDCNEKWESIWQRLIVHFHFLLRDFLFLWLNSNFSASTIMTFCVVVLPYVL